MLQNKREFEKLYQVLSKQEPLRILSKDSLRIHCDSAGKRSKLGSAAFLCVAWGGGGETGLCNVHGIQSDLHLNFKTQLTEHWAGS